MRTLRGSLRLYPCSSSRSACSKNWSLGKQESLAFPVIRVLEGVDEVPSSEPHFAILQECDHSNNERLEGAEIEAFLRRLLKRPELEEIFRRYSGEDRVLSASELLEFLEDQGEDGTTLACAQQLIQTYELNETGE